jgi:hypothetical protein
MALPGLCGDKWSRFSQEASQVTRAATFKKTDVTRATCAVLNAGLDVARIEISTKDGLIVVVPAKPGEPIIKPNG